MHTTLPKTIRTLLMSTLLLSVLATSFVIPPRKVEAGGPVLVVYVATLAVTAFAVFFRDKCPKQTFNASCQKSLSKDGKTIVDNVARKNNLPPMSTDQNVVFFSILLNKLSVAPELISKKPVPLPQLYALFTPWLGKPVIEKIRLLEKMIKDGFTCRNENCVRDVAQKIQRITRFKPGELAAVCSSYSLLPKDAHSLYCATLGNIVSGSPVSGNLHTTARTPTASTTPARSNCKNGFSYPTKNITEEQKKAIIEKILDELATPTDTRLLGLDYDKFIQSNTPQKNEKLQKLLAQNKHIATALQCVGVTDVQYSTLSKSSQVPIIRAKCGNVACVIVLGPSQYIPTYQTPFVGTMEEWNTLVKNHFKKQPSSQKTRLIRA